MKIERRYMHVGMAVLALCASLALLLYVRSSLAEAASFVADAEARINAAQRRFAQVRSFVRLHSDTEVLRSQELELFIPEDDIAAFLESVEALGKEMKVPIEVTRVDLRPAEKPDSYGEVTVSVKAEGSYAQMFRLLSLIETVPYASFITSANLERSNNTWTLTALMKAASRTSR